MQVIPGVYYPVYRLVIIGVTLAVAALLYVIVMRTRLGMLIRAGASNREMVGALGINIKLLYTLVFGLGATLAGFAGLMQAPILTVQIGMGENILILAFVVIIIGGIGSSAAHSWLRSWSASIDTIGRAFLPDILRSMLSNNSAITLGPALASMSIYMLMAESWCFGRRVFPGGEANERLADPRRALINRRSRRWHLAHCCRYASLTGNKFAMTLFTRVSSCRSPRSASI